MAATHVRPRQAFPRLATASRGRNRPSARNPTPGTARAPAPGGLPRVVQHRAGDHLARGAREASRGSSAPGGIAPTRPSCGWWACRNWPAASASSRTRTARRLGLGPRGRRRRSTSRCSAARWPPARRSRTGWRRPPRPSSASPRWTPTTPSSSAGVPTRPAESTGGGPVDVHQTITINRPAEELYRFWRDFENLPRFMSHLESVQADGRPAVALEGEGPGRDDGRVGRRDHRGPAQRADRLAVGRRPTWTTPGRCGSCRRPAAGAPRSTSRCATTRRAASLGKLVAKLFGEAPEQQVYDDLRRFKQVMETGEVVLSEGSFDGSRIVQRRRNPPAAVARR